AGVATRGRTEPPLARVGGVSGLRGCRELVAVAAAGPREARAGLPTPSRRADRGPRAHGGYGPGPFQYPTGLRRAEPPSVPPGARPTLLGTDRRPKRDRHRRAPRVARGGRQLLPVSRADRP